MTRARCIMPGCQTTAGCRCGGGGAARRRHHAVGLAAGDGDAAERLPALAAGVRPMSRPLPPPFAPGDRVRPRAEWAGKLAGGTVARVARWGDTHIVYLVGVGAGAMLASCYEADEGVAA